MASAQDKLIEALQDALATESALAQTLRAHIGIAPRGSYRDELERHLDETHDHADRLATRLTELGSTRSPARVVRGLAKAIVTPTAAVAKTPLDLIRGSSVEEKLLKNARDDCVGEALEIATYRSIEAMARQIEDANTVSLAQSIRQEDEAALAAFENELSQIARDAAKAATSGKQRIDISTIGVVDALRRLQESTQQAVRRVESQTERAARQVRKVPGVARAQGWVRGAFANASQLPIEGYDELNAQRAIEKLSGLTDRELATIDAYERRNRNRRTVLDRIESLQAAEPWPGYDELSVQDIQKVIAGADARLLTRVRDYERRHENRSGVIQTTDRELARS